MLDRIPSVSPSSSSCFLAPPPQRFLLHHPWFPSRSLFPHGVSQTQIYHGQGKGSREEDPKEPAPALHVSEFTDDYSVQALHFLVGGLNNEWERMALLPASSQEAKEGAVPTFDNFLAAGLVPPFFDFFLTMLEHYRLHMLHLHPNVVLVLAILAHLCKGFVGVRPSLKLFRHFYSPRLSSKDNQTSGCVTFCLAGKKEEKSFIPMALYSHVKEWRQSWLLVKTLRGSPWLQEPTAPEEKHAGWVRRAACKAFEPGLQRIRLFAEWGLDGWMVASSFVRLRIAPSWSGRSRFGRSRIPKIADAFIGPLLITRT